MRLEVVEGDITALEVDAIANAANDHLWMGAGVAGAIKRAGGEEIEREAVAKGPIEVGDAVATGAGRLKAKHVIHGAVMGRDLRTSAALVERTTRRCLEVADGLDSAAMEERLRARGPGRGRGGRASGPRAHPRPRGSGASAARRAPRSCGDPGP